MTEQMKENRIVKELGSGQYLNFGKHKGKTILEVYKKNATYLMWCKKNIPLRAETKQIITNILDVKCGHTIIETEPCQKDSWLKWECTDCGKVICNIEYKNCRMCDKLKPNEQLLRFYGCCYKCYMGMCEDEETFEV